MKRGLTVRLMEHFWRHARGIVGVSDTCISARNPLTIFDRFRIVLAEGLGHRWSASWEAMKMGTTLQLEYRGFAQDGLV